MVSSTGVSLPQISYLITSFCPLYRGSQEDVKRARTRSAMEWLLARRTSGGRREFPFPTPPYARVSCEEEWIASGYCRPGDDATPAVRGILGAVSAISGHFNAENLATRRAAAFSCICSPKASSAFAAWVSWRTTGALPCCRFAFRYWARFRHAKLSRKLRLMTNRASVPNEVARLVSKESPVRAVSRKCSPALYRGAQCRPSVLHQFIGLGLSGYSSSLAPTDATLLRVSPALSVASKRNVLATRVEVAVFPGTKTAVRELPLTC